MNDDVFRRALGMDLEDRAALAHELLKSLELEDEEMDEDPRSVEKAWDAELVTRLDDFDSGRIEGVDGLEYIRRVEADLKRRIREMSKKQPH